MPNLVITNACNLSCSFCFASEYRVEPTADTARWMSLESFRAQLRYAGADTVRLCGGEPTLHPAFTQMVEIALAQHGRRAFVMTNGLWPDAVREQLAALPARQTKRISYLVNALAPDSYGPGQAARLARTLETLPSSSVTLGLTIDRATFDYRYILELAHRHRIGRIRFSVAAPNIADPDAWRIDPERDFKQIAATVFALYCDARAAGISVHSDCGYLPPCAFDEAQLATLLEDDSGCAGIDFHCSGPVDIGPDGEAWRCYGLFAAVRGHCDDYADCGALAREFERCSQALDDRPLFDACNSCTLRDRGLCGGGCLAYRVARSLRNKAEAVGVPLGRRGPLLAAVAEVDQARLRLWRRRDGDAAMLLRDGEWHQLRLSELERQLLELCDGQRSVAELINLVPAGGQQAARDTEVCRAVRRLFEQGALVLRPAATPATTARS